MSNEYKDWLREERLERDQFLTEVMGECWHVKTVAGSGALERCVNCGLHTLWVKDYRTNFSTPDGFFKLWKWAKVQGWFQKAKQHVTFAQLIELIDPDKFADAVYHYLRDKR